MQAVEGITLYEVEGPFDPKPEGVRELRIETSASNGKNPGGPFRMAAVDNGRYGRRHVVTTDGGEVVGAIKNGFRDVGYTWHFVYSEVAKAFVVLHQYYRAEKRCLSFLGAKGRFGWFDRTPRFTPSDSILLESHWVTSVKAFQFIAGGARILLLTEYGLATVDLRERKLIGLEEFACYGGGMDSDLSPTADIVAIVSCVVEERSESKGEICDNRLNLYDVYNCKTLVELKLKTSKPIDWLVRFSRCGNYLALKDRRTLEGSSDYCFEIRNE